MKKKSILVGVAVIALLVAVLFLGNFKKSTINQTAQNAQQNQQELQTVVLDTYTGTLVSNVCGNINVTLIFKKNSIVSKSKDRGTCKEEKVSSTFNGTFKEEGGVISITFNESKEENIDLVRLGEGFAISKVYDETITSIDNTKTVFLKTQKKEYISEDKNSSITAEYAVFQDLETVRLSQSENNAPIMLFKKSLDIAKYENLKYKWTLEENSAILTTATSSIRYIIRQN